MWGHRDQAGAAARLDQLTALRFFAALAVMVSHMGPIADEPSPQVPAVVRHLAHQGTIGVSFFFMLSGFILAHTYGARLRAGAISRRRYLALRVARIVPLHWLTALPFAAALLAARGWAAVPVVVANLALVQAWLPGVGWYLSLNAPSWSLSDEAFFYTAFAGLALLPWRWLVAVAVLVVAGDVALAAGLVLGGQGEAFGPAGLTATHWLTTVLPLTRLGDFVLGVVIRAMPPLRLAPRVATGAEAGAALLVPLAMAALPALGVPGAVRMQVAFLPVMAVVVAVFAAGQGALSRRLAGSSALVLLGEASFALYLIHLPLVSAAFAWWDRLGRPGPVGPVAVLVGVGCVALSLAVFRWVEGPLLRWSRGLVDRVWPR